MNFEFLRSKNSVVILYNAVPGGGGTDAAGYKPHDVCVSKLELTSIQGRMLVNGWHRMGELKSSKDFNSTRGESPL